MSRKGRPILMLIAGIVLTFFIATGVTYCGLQDMKNGYSSVPDYSSENYWAYFAEGTGKDVDVFLIAPTVYTGDEFNMPLTDAAVRKNFLSALNMERGIYEENARLYAPYYRQAAMKIYYMSVFERSQYLEKAYKDISDAFSWYLENENEGRPIILAGFSQGADMCYRLLKDYFTDEVLRSRLVAVYAIGWAFTESDVLNHPQMVPAAGEADTGVIISFECEADTVTDSLVIPIGTHAISINPLNWRTDDEPADASLNPGACFPDAEGRITYEIPEFCGCYIDPSRGSLIVTGIDPSGYKNTLGCMPEGSYHVYDYQFFYRALQENVGTRIQAYMN